MLPSGGLKMKGHLMEMEKRTFRSKLIATSLTLQLNVSFVLRFGTG